MAGSAAAGLARRGVDCISRRDRVHYSQRADRIDSLSRVNKPSLRAHEDGVMSCFSHFLARGLPVAAGWRSWEQLKASGISPEGMVFLERSPYGPTRAYFEYERTARGEARVRRKFNGDGCPVLIVCWNDDAESVFQRLGSGMGIPLLTTTIKRLEEHGPLDNFGCWSVYGQPPHRLTSGNAPGSASFAWDMRGLPGIGLAQLRPEKLLRS